MLLDVRENEEVAGGMLAGAVHIPLGQLRGKLSELPKDKRIAVYCKVGLRGYLAERILKENGFDAANLSGGWLTWCMVREENDSSDCGGSDGGSRCCCGDDAAAASPSRGLEPTRRIDVSALQCPGPIVRVTREIETLAPGETLALKALRNFEPDLESWCRSTGNELVCLKTDGDSLQAVVRKTACWAENPAPASRGPTPAGKTAAVVVFSNDLDRVMASFMIATGLASTGVKVSMFFTFWGLSVLRKAQSPPVVKDLLSRMFGFMLPKGARKLTLSKMHMMGMGTVMMKYVMGKKNVPSLPRLIQEARDLGVRFIACDMAMDVMGLQRTELLDEVDDVAGVASFAALANESDTTLFF